MDKKETLAYLQGAVAYSKGDKTEDYLMDNNPYGFGTKESIDFINGYMDSYRYDQEQNYLNSYPV